MKKGGRRTLKIAGPSRGAAKKININKVSMKWKVELIEEMM